MPWFEKRNGQKVIVRMWKKINGVWRKVASYCPPSARSLDANSAAVVTGLVYKTAPAPAKPPKTPPTSPL